VEYAGRVIADAADRVARLRALEFRWHGGARSAGASVAVEVGAQQRHARM